MLAILFAHAVATAVALGTLISEALAFVALPAPPDE